MVRNESEIGLRELLIDLPATQYARSDDVAIAYQVFGRGDVNIVLVHGWISNVEHQWDEPRLTGFLERLSSFSRLAIFDKRGTGLSDRVSEDRLPTLEQRMEDVKAVMNAAGFERAALIGISEGGPMCILFAATYPERASALITIGSYARRISTEDYPWGISEEEHAAFLKEIDENWGGPVGLAKRAPSMMDDPNFVRWWSSYLRVSASPKAVLAISTMNGQIDVRTALPLVQVPTLIIHRTGDRALNVGGSRYMADQIPGARLVELPGEDHLPWVGNQDEILDEIEEFLTGVRHVKAPERALATVMFTDIVGSTEKAVALGDRNWRILLDRHDQLVRRELERFRGKEIKVIGDGFLATFDGPARGIQCAAAVRRAAGGLGIETRAGLHNGEVDLRGDDVGGIAVHLAARVAALATSGEVLVSRTVADLVAGSGIEFQDRGEHELKGIPGKWQLLSATV